MRPGAALPTVLLSLALMAALSVGGSFVTRRYLADARLFQRSSDVESVLEGAMTQAAAGLDTASLGSLNAGATLQLVTPVELAQQGLVTSVWVTRLGASTYLLVGEVRTSFKPLVAKRLSVLSVVDSAGLQPAPLRAWSQLP